MELFADRNQEFMYHKSDADPDQNISQDSLSERCVTGEGGFQLEQSPVCKAFPEILAGGPFLDQIAERAETWDKFHVLVVRLDPVKVQEGEVTGEDAMLVSAEAASDFCETLSGFWGILCADCLACVVQVLDPAEVLPLAEKLRDSVKGKCGKTVSIGIAEYPLLSYMKKDILHNARKALDHALCFGPGSVVQFDAVSLNISGDKLYQKGDVDGAVNEFATALLLDPDNVNVRNSLGVCHGVKGKRGKALEEFQKAMNLDPEDVMAPYNAGLIHLMKKKKDKALEFFMKAFALDETRFEVVLQLGRLHLERKDPQKALEFLEKAVELQKESGPAHRLLGECRRELKMTDEAIKSYTEAVRLNGNDAYSLSALGGLYAEQGKNMEIALVFCRQSVELAPENAVFRNRLATVYSKLEKYEEALEEFKRAAELGHDCESLIGETEERLRPMQPEIGAAN